MKALKDATAKAGWRTLDKNRQWIITRRMVTSSQQSVKERNERGLNRTREGGVGSEDQSPAATLEEMRQRSLV